MSNKTLTTNYKTDSLAVISKDRVSNWLNTLDVSDNTLISYKKHSHRFIDFIKDNGAINELTLLDYKRDLKDDNNLAIATKNLYFITAKQVSKILFANNLIHLDITKANGIDIKGFKSSKLHKKDGLTDDELNDLINYLNNLNADFKGLRVKLLISLLLTQGLRQAEVSNIKVNDINLKNKTLMIKGKGLDDKQAITLLDNNVVLIKQYLKVSKRADGYLFYALAGSKAGEQLNTSGIKKIVKNVFKECGIDKTTHTTRHTFINQLLKNYDNLLDVAKYSRHSNLNMIMVYADELKTEADRPRFNKVFRELKVV